jgi:hypothetical protein
MERRHAPAPGILRAPGEAVNPGLPLARSAAPADTLCRSPPRSVSMDASLRDTFVGTNPGAAPP